MDFTIEKYRQLLLALRRGGYEFVPFRDYIVSREPALVPALALENSKKENAYAARATDDAAPDGTLPGARWKRVILRHDVDRLPENSLRLARLEHELRVTGTYYFRIVPESYDRQIMKEIADDAAVLVEPVPEKCAEAVRISIDSEDEYRKMGFEKANTYSREKFRSAVNKYYAAVSQTARI